jgi:6-phosphogluconolactonase
MDATIRIFPSVDEIANAVAEMLLRSASVPGREPIHIALSGGNTPKQIYKYLNDNYGSKLANNRFHFWWGDDRCVPPTNNDSNYRWANDLWLEPIGITLENIHRIIGENDPEMEANRYSEAIKNSISTSDGLPRFNLIFLGLGDDGHTASIFPNCMELLTSEKWCEVAIHPTSGQKRITLTGKVINNAEKIVFISTGTGKAQMIQNVAIGSMPEFPASHIKPKSGEVIWLIDEDAAM